MSKHSGNLKGGRAEPMKTERKKSKKNTYKDYLKQEMNGLIEAITLTELQKRFMKGRWLDQLLWLEGRATRSRDRYYLLRLMTIIGGVIVPALVSVNSTNADGRDARLRHIFGWTAFGLSQVVAISAAVEELFHYGESYRRYRNSAEGMKIEGWQFFQLSGPYSGAKDHEDAYATFAANIENIIQKDVEGYVSQTSQTEAQLKEKTQATIERNIALADKHLQEQLRQPPPPPPSRPQFPNRIQRGYNPSTPPGMPEEGEDEFLTPAQLQNQRVGLPGSPGRFPSTSAPFAANSPINSNPAPGFALEEDEDEFVSPAQIGGMQGNFNGTTPSPNSATISFNSVTVAALEEDDDDFVSPAQIGSVQIGTNGNKAVVVSSPLVATPTPLPPPPVATPAPPPPPPLATPEVVAEILECPLKETQTYLPGVLEALQEKGILDKPTLIAAIATIRVETGGFCPINEYGGDAYFTREYEYRDDLGNCQPGDGARYHGRGFIQITGRANYREYGQKLGCALEDNPELALDAKIGAKILASYFYDREIDRAAQEGDWRLVRKLVNGGYNGWDEFEYFVQRACSRL